MFAFLLFLACRLFAGTYACVQIVINWFLFIIFLFSVGNLYILYVLILTWNYFSGIAWGWNERKSNLRRIVVSIGNENNFRQHIDGLVRMRRNPIANTLRVRLSRANSSTCMQHNINMYKGDFVNSAIVHLHETFQQSQHEISVRIRSIFWGGRYPFFQYLKLCVITKSSLCTDIYYE